METGKRSLISVRELFESSISFYRKNWKLLTSIQLAPALITALSYIFARPQFVGNIGIFIFLALMGAVATGFSWLATMWVVARDENASVKEAYRKSLSLAVPAFVVGILSTLAVLLGFILLIVPGIYLLVVFSFGNYVLFADGLKGSSALKASKYYVKGYWWGVAGRYLVLGLVAMVFQIIFSLFSNGTDWQSYQVALQSGTDTPFKGPSIGDYLSSIVNIFVFTPISIVYAYRLFESLKEIKGKYTPMAR
jgi:hypothetical protein